MAQTKSLAQFRIELSDDGESAQIHIEDDGGETLELTATRDQLDLLADTLDEMLSESEEADEA